MRMISIFLVLTSFSAFAGGYATPDIFKCQSNGQSFEFSIGPGEGIKLSGDSIGHCEGRAWVSGGSSTDCFGAAKLDMDNKCQAGVSALAWTGCFRPKKQFMLEVTHLNQSKEKLTCTLVKRGGDYNMDGSHH